MEIVPNGGKSNDMPLLTSSLPGGWLPAGSGVSGAQVGPTQRMVPGRPPTGAIWEMPGARVVVALHMTEGALVHVVPSWGQTAAFAGAVALPAAIGKSRHDTSPAGPCRVVNVRETGNPCGTLATAAQMACCAASSGSLVSLLQVGLVSQQIRS